MTITPTATVIKSDGGNHNHPRNKVYNKLVAANSKTYVLLAHKDIQTKNAIESSIYEQAIRKQSPPGRFLEKDKGVGWIILFRKIERECVQED